MFERFTDRARRVVVLAQEEARALNHNCVGPEHVLLGLVREGQGLAAKALTELGVDLSAVRQQIEELIGRGQQSPSGRIPFTPRTKKVLELSLREAIQLGHNYIGTEHILLAVLREGDNVGAQVLVRMGTDLNQVRVEVLKLLSGAAASSLGGSAEPSGEIRPGRQRQIRMARAAVSHDVLLTEVRNALAGISERLTAIERHLGMRGADPGAEPDPGPDPHPEPHPEPGRAEESGEAPGDVTASGE
jgi:ATP-dependent Clp protease ATP-binding subunit ClpA